MLGTVEITPWHWVGFIVCVLVFIAVDMGALNKQARVVSFGEALIWSLIWFCVAMLFACQLYSMRGREEATEFVTGYLIELSLSLDNILVITLIFTAFKIPLEFQRRVLVWGIVGALAMRGVMIGAGAVLVQHFTWILYIFGAFLTLTGVKMCFSRTQKVDPDRNPVVRLVRNIFPVTTAFHGQNFFLKLNGRMTLTPLALVLLMVETTDLIFAVDSVPAVFSVTREAFIVFTSNVFAILGLRSLYFLLAGAIEFFRYLKTGLAAVLVFIGIKMLLDPHDQPPRGWQLEIPTGTSLCVVAAILSISIALSITRSHQEKKALK